MRESFTRFWPVVMRCATVVLCASVVVLTACTAMKPQPEPRREAFVPPVLTLDELRELSMAASGQVRGGVYPAFAGVICHAKGYRVGSNSFASCQALVAKAARRNPEALVRAQMLASIANQLIAPAAGEPVPRGSGSGAVVQQVLCYDLNTGVFTACEDI